MQNRRLTFAQMQQEFEPLTQPALRSIKGGVAAVEYEYAIDANDNWYWRVVGEETWIAGSTLNAVEITRHQSEPNWGVYITSNPFGIGGYPTGGGGDTGGGTPLTQQQWYVAISTMLSSMDLSVSAGTISAHIMGISMPAGYIFTGHVLTATSMLDNAVQISEGFNWNDASQLGVGGVLIGTAFVFSAPISVPVVFIGGVGLFIWELAENQNQW